MESKFYITTPIYYVNSHPHIGHAYTTVVADVLRRYHQLFEQPTYFLTGTDEHGQKIAESAKKENCTPQEFVNRISQEFKDLWPYLNIEYDYFVRTTDAHHKAFVQSILKKIYDNGEIYLREYEGLYCVGCERFLDESELIEGKCHDHQKTPEQRQEKNYFFQMSRYQDWLVQSIESNPELIYPTRYRNEVLQFLKSPLQDLCISRPKERLTWGIELPFDSNFVTYVWFDALLNYVSALEHEKQYDNFWPHVHHLIGKDILKTHAIYWPCMLHAAGIPIFKHLLVHGHWVSSGSKMSKSVGNVINPLDMKDLVGVDALRYFLIRDMSFGEDSNFTQELVITRYNGELANNIGNLINRSISMCRQHFNQCIPPRGTPEETEQQLYQAFQDGVAQIKNFIEGFQLHRALEVVATLSSHVNKYLDTCAPWNLAKQENSRDRLGTVLYTAVDMSRIVATILLPVMPEKMTSALEAMGISKPSTSWNDLCPGLLVENIQIPAPSPLFPKIKPAEVQPETRQQPQEHSEMVETDSAMITIDEFSKMVLKVGKILSSEKVKKSDKLLHSQVDVGEDKPRSIVSGIALHYQPEDIIGRNVMVVSNLKPAKLRGILSEGMILCTDDGTKLNLVEPPAEVPPGTVIK
ncbi:MAG: methionine--tRNA ligase [SAR324 cluster bacterium]|nr:methionine--tRNA ligase [SAR324 cluster bacterium]